MSRELSGCPAPKECIKAHANLRVDNSAGDADSLAANTDAFDVGSSTSM